VSITEHRLTIARTARYYQIGEVNQKTTEVWLCCHGYGQLAARFAQRFETIASEERVIVAPEGLHRFYLDPPDRPATDRRVGATWMTREDRETDIRDYIEYLEQVCALVCSGPAQSAQVIGFGFSQGTATIARWAAVTQHNLSRLVLWGSGLPPDLDWARAVRRYRSLQITLVTGEQDEFATPAGIAAQQQLLREQGLQFDTIGYAGGHQLDEATLRRLTETAS
jgi:predicted esterase